jgi:DNA polymerase
MSNELKDIRAALEHQMALFGDLVVVPASPDSEVPHSVLPPEPSPESSPEPSPESLPLPVSEQETVLQTAPEPQKEPVQNEPEATTATPATGDGVYERISALIPEDSPLRGMSSLEEVQTWVAATELIELDRSRINPVFGVGNPQANLLVIGEAPGADEDKKGEPFVGRAGQLLTKILEAIGFERSEVYIANILKSRPPDNRKPKPDEISAHMPILHKQIALIQPKLILCVGRTSGTSLLGIDSSLKNMRGTFHDYHGIPVLVTYHPAALLRNPNWKRPTWEDVQLLRERYDKLTA